MPRKEKAKADEAEEQPEAIAEAAPAEPPPPPLTGLARFRAEFLAGEPRRLRWEQPTAPMRRLHSPMGILSFADGTPVELSPAEASALASELQALRPRDNIQVI